MNRLINARNLINAAMDVVRTYENQDTHYPIAIGKLEEAVADACQSEALAAEQQQPTREELTEALRLMYAHVNRGQDDAFYADEAVHLKFAGDVLARMDGVKS